MGLIAPTPIERCDLAPKGYVCTKRKGHVPPCTFEQVTTRWSRFKDALGELAGNFLYRGPR